MKRSGDSGIGRSSERKITWDRKIGEPEDRQETLHSAALGREQTTNVLGAIRHAPTQQTGSYQGTSFSRAVTRKTIWALAPVFLRNAIRIVLATLSEIFDESAYNRFLLRTHRLRSVASYRDFMSERDAAMAKKPRCC